MSANDNKSRSTTDTATKALEFVPAVAVVKPAALPETRALEFIPGVIAVSTPVQQSATAVATPAAELPATAAPAAQQSNEAG